MEMDHGDVEDALAPKQRELDEALLQLRIPREVEARMGRAAPTVSLLPAQRRLDQFRGDVGALQLQGSGLLTPGPALPHTRGP